MKIRINIPSLQKNLRDIAIQSKTKRDAIKRLVVVTATKIQGEAKETVHVDTGRLRNSIDMSATLETNTAEAEVGSDVEYAGFHEAKYPYLLPAAKQERNEFVAKLKQILRK